MSSLLTSCQHTHQNTGERNHDLCFCLRDITRLQRVDEPMQSSRGKLIATMAHSVHSLYCSTISVKLHAPSPQTCARQDLFHHPIF